MLTLSYLYSKFFKVILQGKSIRNSKINDTAKIYSGTEFYDSSIGKHSYIGYNSEIHSCDIGSFCSIANGLVVGGAKHPLEWVSTSSVFYHVGGGTGRHLGNLKIEPIKRTKIGNDVWIGSRVTIIQGITIGNGAAIGAGSIVTKDVPPYAVVVGCPARIIKYRFDKETINELQKSKWWEMTDVDLRKYSSKFNNVHEFLSSIKT